MSFRIIIALVLIAALGTLQCKRDFSTQSIDTPVNTRELTVLEKTVMQSSNAFGFNLFQAIHAEKADSNYFISPLSVSIALGMAYNGTATTTEEAMRNTLEYGNLTVEEINQSYKSIIELLMQLDPEVIMEIANSMWYRLGFPVESSFIDANQTYFDAEIRELDFSLPSAIDIINGWISDKTHGKIEEVITEIDPLTVMFLINAIYFKASWTTEFDEDDTRDAPFTRPDQSQVTCKMMRMETDLRYLETEDFQAVTLPYGNGRFRMTVFLPKEGKEVDDVAEKMNDGNWAQWMGNLEETTVHLQMPRFKMEFMMKLNDILKAMGMEIAFTGQADFSLIAKDWDLFISNVIHKTFVEVNEEGTEAAAVTVVEISLTSSNQSKTVLLNRPFLFVIHDDQSNLLFMGQVVNPVE